MTSSRRRKEGGRRSEDATVEGDNPQSRNQVQRIEEPDGINLHVVLPSPASGINLVIDNDGDALPEGGPNVDVDNIRKEGEAKILIGIQKEVGFTFDVDEGEIQS
ncbi:hypothetical protein A2U01_0063885, partial [Trifolium medium]|nr:hypothetical protein [Trifolium medium]